MLACVALSTDDDEYEMVQIYDDYHQPIGKPVKRRIKKDSYEINVDEMEMDFNDEMIDDMNQADGYDSDDHFDDETYVDKDEDKYDDNDGYKNEDKDDGEGSIDEPIDEKDEKTKRKREPSSTKPRPTSSPSGRLKEPVIIEPTESPILDPPTTIGDDHRNLMVKVYRGPTQEVNQKPFASWGYFIKYPNDDNAMSRTNNSNNNTTNNKS